VGTGGSLAGNEGTTVRCGVAAGRAAGGGVVVAVAGLAGVADVVEEDAGLAAVVDVVEAVVGFAAVVVVAAAFGAGLAHAEQTDVDEMLRCDIRYADGAALDDDDAERRAMKLLRADVVAMLTDQLVRA
jgi:hypothetical protein